MTKPFEEWTVLPHGRVRYLEDNLISVAGVLKLPPMGDVVRRMTIARLDDGRLVVYSAIALDEAEMKAIEDFGKPSWLVVPSGLHRMDVKAWKERYPAIRVVAPVGARERVEELVPVDATEVQLADPSVSLVTVPGTAEREAAMIVHSQGGTTLVLNDIVFNLVNRKGLKGWFFKAIGMTGDEPHLPGLIKMRLIEDDEAVRAQLERWSRIPDLKRVIVSHGAMIEEAPGEKLSRVAQSLAA
jgi:hypothetical protein